MGQMVLKLGGSVLGNAIGGPLLGAVGGALGNALGGALFGAHGKASNLADMKFSSSSWGEPIPVLYGTARLPGKMIWAGEMITNNAPKGKGSSSKGGGKKTSKGMGKQPYVVIDFAMAFCEGPDVTVSRIWADGNLVFDRKNQTAVANNPYWQMTFYSGTETQTPHPNMANWVTRRLKTAPGALPHYKGLSYIFFQNINITPFGNRIPNITAECTKVPINGVPATYIAKITGGALDAGLTSSVGTRGLDQQWGCADYVTQKFFAVAPDGLRVIDLVTNKEIRQVALPFTPIGVGVLQDGGGLYITDDGGVVHNYDQNSFTSKGFLYLTTLFSFGCEIVCGTVAFSKSQREVAMVSANYGVIAMVDGSDMSVQAVTDLPCGSGFTFGTRITKICNGAISHDGKSEFWIANVGDDTMGILHFTKVVAFDQVSIEYLTGSPVGFTERVGVTVTDMGSVLPADISPGLSGYVVPYGLSYDRTDDSLICGVGGGHLFKWSPTKGIVWSVSGVNLGSQRMMSQALLQDGTFGYWDQDASAINQFTLRSTVTGEVVHSAAIISEGTWSAFGGQIYDSVSQTVIMSNSDSGFLRAYLGRSRSSTYSLSSILDDVCVRSNLDISHYDTSAVTSQVTGFVVTQLASGKDVINHLAECFFFDTIESDYKLKFVPRGGATVATIGQSDLSGGTGSSGDYWVHTRAQEQELPIQVNIKFSDPNNSYQDSMAYYRRNLHSLPIVKSTHKESLEVPLVMSLTTANNIAAQWLFTVWAERDSYRSEMGWQYLHLDPADNVTVSLDNGDNYTVRITSTELGGDYSIKTAFVGEDMDVYTPQYAEGALATASGYNAVVPSLPRGRLMFLDTPLLSDTDNTGGHGTRVYYGVGPYNFGFRAAAVFQSTDNENYNDWAFVTTQLTWGTATNILPAPASLFATDTVNEITVVIANLSVEITTLSTTDFLAGANMALIGKEIVHFQNAALNADGSYTLSNLIRGARGTEWAVGTHTAGELFTIIESSGVNSVVESVDKIGVTQHFKLLGAGGTLDGSLAIVESYSGNDLKPYAPVNFSRAVVGSDLAVSWVRRGRYGAALMSGTGTIPLGEGEERYDAYILAAPYDPAAANWKAPTTFVRSYLTLTSPGLTYLAAQMSTDSFVPASSTLHLVVFQNSSVVGHGWPGSTDLAPF